MTPISERRQDAAQDQATVAACDPGPHGREDRLNGGAPGRAWRGRAATHQVRPRLRRSVDPRITEAGTLYVLRGPDQPDLELTGPVDLLQRLLTLADGTRTFDTLADELAPGEAERAELRQLAEALIVEGVLDDAQEEGALLPAGEVDRFGRQLAYFADMAGSAAAAARCQRRLSEATVCLLGLGGLGSWVAWGLACAGVGTLVGVDGDELEVSNLNRQILFSEADLGKSKATAAGAALRAFRGGLCYHGLERTLDGVDAVRSAIRGTDFVLDSLDSPPHKITRWVSEACFAEGIPYLALSQHPPLIRIGPLYVPGETGCYACQEAKYRREYPLFRVLEESKQIRPPSATFGPACGVVGTLAANEVVAWLTGLHPPSCLGNAALLDLRTLSVEREAVEAEPDCRVCRPAVSRP